MRRPNSMGISFSLKGDRPRIRVTGSARQYKCLQETDSGVERESEEEASSQWKPIPIEFGQELPVSAGLAPHPGPTTGLRWWVRGVQQESGWQLTVVLENTEVPEPGRAAFEESSFFHCAFRVAPCEGARLIPRRPSRPATDDDAIGAALIYRDIQEWAVGHTCGATWPDGATIPPHVETTWLPRQTVRATSADGHKLFREIALQKADARRPFSAKALAEAPPDVLAELLAVVPDAYEKWLSDEQDRAARLHQKGDLSDAHHSRTREHLRRARLILQRIRDGAALIQRDKTVRQAFQLAQKAMLVQARWKNRQPEADLTWRPFQLGFQLLSLASIAAPAQANGAPTTERLTMDLLWFPTGGGKTEAYLALIAFTLLHRRLRYPKEPDRGAGVTVLMRYTLRLLTVQQFERATRLILACEKLRCEPARKNSLGRIPFSIGLWVGRAATPNTVKDARESADERAKAAQLARCPACGEDALHWDAEPEEDKYSVKCTHPQCPFADELLPVWTIDEDVYRECPSLLIGTVDKFAQIVRRRETHGFFGGPHPPPELVLQDELHLISGPLGTITALYEAAIDRLCTSPEGIPPKIIGSTATIRRAEDQVRALFDRAVSQFPPPVLDASDSCFGVPDKNGPGRVYVGVSTVGRSPKFVLQAVCATLLQGAYELPEPEKDPYWTLVTYFNSLRELGGAHMMMLDDVRDSIQLYAKLHGTSPRVLSDEPAELTSRVKSDDIPKALRDLERSYPDQDADVVLATNMLSVGVDIPRLGLMVVNGQPKSMAEYIQATSRVGRNKVAGLIITVYNAGRPRDRSHFEAFKTWHGMLYREVEATSVTPFAPGARDRALHAALVALVRHLMPGKLTDDNVTLSDEEMEEAQSLVDYLAERARHVDPREEMEVATEARQFLEQWNRRGHLKHYWNNYVSPDDTLLVDAEKVAQAKAVIGSWGKAAYGTPNTMREVEPIVRLRLAQALKSGDR
ncbi:DNA/RNA helicase [Myxococcus sp. AM001]|nr:DNA/RNA helicase [Myxococcus sp. AM001]